MATDLAGVSGAFEALSGRILEAFRAGATLDEASRGLDLKVRTVRDWAHRGRKSPEGRYGAFARELDAIRAARRLPAPSERGALTRVEWEEALAVAVRAGNVAAMKLWWEAHQGVPADDAFSEFDRES